VGKKAIWAFPGPKEDSSRKYDSYLVRTSTSESTRMELSPLAFASGSTALISINGVRGTALS
jgi:hypothetical protein